MELFMFLLGLVIGLLIPIVISGLLGKHRSKSFRKTMESSDERSNT